LTRQRTAGSSSDGGREIGQLAPSAWIVLATELAYNRSAGNFLFVVVLVSSAEPECFSE
jgi:hypothetical protein